jgi:UDP-N-acetylmuramate dehydrogenase
MQVNTDVALKPYNTFAVEAFAEHYATFSSLETLRELLSLKVFGDHLPVILGGGSNVLFTGNPRTVLKNEITGIEKIDEDDQWVYVKAGAGEHWHTLVSYSIDQGWAGLENLSLIPGSVGAAPMQNIGAYGVEIKEVIHSVEAFHLREKRLAIFSAADCEFGYRESVFKHRYRGEFAILYVTVRLAKRPHFNLAYGTVRQELERMGVEEPTLRTVSQAIIHIRSSKLPDPAVIGNAGSFFKNPEVSAVTYRQLKEAFPDIIAFPVEDRFKLAAGWLIEACGWKGYRDPARPDGAGVHERQALVLVNLGNASGKEILALSKKIQESVQKKFGISLSREVNVVE